MQPDILIVGAGPAGLSFARTLAGSGLAITMVEPQSAETLAAPPFDGREIALTHHSASLLRDLGIWARIPPDGIHALRDARVFNGETLPGLHLDHAEGDRAQLGYLVANHLIRGAAFEAVAGQEGVTLLSGRKVVGIAVEGERCRARLADGEVITPRLVVAADSRFSETRRAMGIPADMHDFGKTMLVCRMRHEVPHGHVAWEWFGHGQTLALLPLEEHEASVVLTLPHAEIERLLAASEEEFSAELKKRFRSRLGTMQLSSTRHAYPLIGVYPKHFVAGRFALVGDAAVGMHPVTAHGFNFGLLGADLLAAAIKDAARAGRDIGAASLLAGYERAFRRATRPLYLATLALARLYTDERLPALALRRAGMAAAAAVPAARRALVRGLMLSGDSQAATRPLLQILRSLRP